MVPTQTTLSKGLTSPKFQSLLTGGVLRICRTASHSWFSSKPGIGSNFALDALRSSSRELSTAFAGMEMVSAIPPAVFKKPRREPFCADQAELDSNNNAHSKRATDEIICVLMIQWTWCAGVIVIIQKGYGSEGKVTFLIQ
jgi:hypothetical protein